MSIHGSGARPGQGSSAWLCTTHLLMHKVTAGGLHPVPACLAYSADDPFTVYLDSHTDTDIPVTWELSRDLLALGTQERVGVGDVSVYPGHGRDADSLYLLLTGRDADGEAETALMRAQASDVEAFLRWTERIVPPGSEPDHFDADGLVRQLLGQDIGEG
ncbi:SsgA family sporulation/cell division regulator [Streptomyces cavernicola]|uniref:SsgA family sporulation/cell division regulator n=1 Tax=Streptomyces cavernicola TaxID=3043613 RepID=A0ABT6SBZ2_9ACTN|nr:SsgA family sporulation/cell division regulator [Streptomyces sp. B-S-A6]MDI3405706.1 SsgA family sporulation/cell division regulator [Streptomyces sp. B-S-A6]